jgi:virginiamycin B lyase
VAGPDGALWFTEVPGYESGQAAKEGPKIGRTTTAGVITKEFPLHVSSVPGIVISGVADDLWFTQLGVVEGQDGARLLAGGGNKIGRITLAGIMTEYAIPTGGNGATSLTIGPDGNIWFTDGDANKIGRIAHPGKSTTNRPTPDPSPR